MRNIIVAILAFFLMSCEEFQTESFSASDTDINAINALADSVSISLSAKSLINYDSTWSNTALDTITTQLYDTLAIDSVIAEVLETAYSLKIPADNDTSYVVFSVSTSKMIVFVGEYVDIKIVDSSGKTSLPDDTSMELTAIYESLNGLTSTDHYLKSRYVFNSVPQNAILQFLRTEQTEKTKFNLIINQ